jgi:MFS family permease
MTRDPRSARRDRATRAAATIRPGDPVWDGQHWVEVDPATGRPRRVRDEAPQPSGPLVTPLRATLALGLFIGVGLMAFALIIQRGQDVPLLAAAAFVLGVVCAGYGITGAIAVYQAAADGRGGKAFGLAVLGGIAAIAAFGFLAMAVIFGLLWKPPAA